MTRLVSLQLKSRHHTPRIPAAGEPGGAVDWWDLCAGPHVESTGKINPAAISLDSVAGAYWRGDETKAQLQRVYGSAWKSKEQMKAWKALQVEAARRWVL